MEKAIRTERLILRPWREDDAEALYEYARDPRVGPAAGWAPHTSVEFSREIIRTVLSGDNTYAVTIRALGDSPVGSAGVFPTDALPDCGEPEIGYWIGVPFWGQGYIPEAVRALQRFAFEVMGAQRVWCAHYEGNEKSKRVIEKCGFTPMHSRMGKARQLDELRLEHFYAITREAWQRG
jgi:ribosomal-protein-alanine N-acetyltransferase